MDMVRIQLIKEVAPFQAQYQVAFFATKYIAPDGSTKSLTSPIEISSEIRTLNSGFILGLQAGISNPAYFNEPHAALGGATPNQILQSFNPEFKGIMEGADFTIESINF